MSFTEMKLNYILPVMGNASFDMEEFRQTETYHVIYENMDLYANVTDEGAPEVLEYWEKRGLKKELHQADQAGEKWASYLPLEAIEKKEEKKYPLLFVLHGSNNPIYLAETYGYVNIAAREKLIVIMPEKETRQRVDQLFEYAKEKYPVDLSRVYMVGFSLGGMMTAINSLNRPERYAAVGIGGMLFANGAMDEYPHMGETWPRETFTEEMIEHAAEVRLPMIDVMGEQEMIDVMPVTKDLKAPEGDAYDSIYFKSSNKIASLNNWRRIAGCEPIPEAQVRTAAADAEDITVKKLGFPFEKTQVRCLEGRNHYVGDCVNPDGETLARFVCIEKTPHWPSQAHTELVWEFISQFAREPETGKLVRI